MNNKLEKFEINFPFIAEQKSYGEKESTVLLSFFRTATGKNNIYNKYFEAKKYNDKPFSVFYTKSTKPTTSQINKMIDKYMN